MLQNRLYKAFAGLSLRTKVTIGIVVPLLLILGLFTAIEYMRQRTILLNNLSLLASNAGQVIENNLRQEMLKSDFEGVQNVLDAVGADEAFRVLYLMDTNGEVIFAPREEGIGRRLDNSLPDCQPCHRLPPEERPESVVVTAADGQRVFRSMQPIENDEACSECHDPDQRLIGVLLTDISIAEFEAPLSGYLREDLLWWAGSILATVLIVNLTLSRFVLVRLENLSAAISRFGQDQVISPLNDHHPDEIGILTSAFRTMADKVLSRTRENRILSERLHRQSAQRGELLRRLISAQEDERKRVARELHDDLGQVFTGLALNLEVVKRNLKVDPEKALQQLDQTRDLVAAGSDRMYDLILALRPSVLDDLGLVPALRAHADQLLAETGINYKMDTSGMNGRLPPETETALYRIFQEALSNVVRHADATDVLITMASSDHVFTGTISDNGSGFDLSQLQNLGSSAGGFGLLGMKERVTQCGGHLEVESGKGTGTKIFIEVPFTKTSDE